MQNVALVLSSILGHDDSCRTWPWSSPSSRETMAVAERGLGPLLYPGTRWWLQNVALVLPPSSRDTMAVAEHGLGPLFHLTCSGGSVQGRDVSTASPCRGTPRSRAARTPLPAAPHRAQSRANPPGAPTAPPAPSCRLLPSKRAKEKSGSTHTSLIVICDTPVTF